MKLDDELSGLIHLSELSAEPIKDPQKVVKVGQEVDAKVIVIDPDEHRIGLSLKALQEPPMEDEKAVLQEKAESEKADESEKKKKTKKKEG